MTWFWGSNDESQQEPDVVAPVMEAVDEIPEVSEEVIESTPDLTVDTSKLPEEGDAGVITGMGFISGQTFQASTEAHGGLVKLLKENYGGSITGGSKGGNAESQILQSVHGGLKVLENKHTNLENAIKETLTNLSALKTFTDEGYNTVVSIGYECDEEQIKSRLNSVKDIHKMVLEEVDRQMGILKNLLKVTVQPTSKSLSELIHKHKDYMKVMDVLADYDYGSKEASDRLALVFNGIKQSGLMKEKVQKALKQMSMTEKEYKSTKNLTELRKKLYTDLKKLASSKIEGEKVNDIFSAMKVLEQHHADKDKLGGTVTFGGMMKNAAKEFGETYTGGEPSRSSVKRRTALSNRLKKKQKTTKEVMKSFIKDVNLRFNAMKDSIDEVSTKIGSSVPYDENMKEFINSFSKLGEIGQQNIYFSLVGYDVANSTQKQQKARFLDDLDIIIKSLEPLIKGPQGSYFNNIKQNIVALLDVIDTYTTVIHGIKTAKVATGGKPTCTKINKKEYQDLTSTSINLIKSTANKLSFYGKVAVIRDNLACISKEHETYSEGYDKLIGKAIGEELSRINKQHKELTDAINESNYDNKNDLHYAAKYDKESRVGLYKTVEAIDLYLMNFSDAIAKNPQAVNELEKMLQSTQIIAQWFVDKSGDNFVEAFNLTAPANEQSYETCKKAVESISVLKNIMSMFIHIGEKFGSIKLQDKIHMSANTIYKNLVRYIWTSAVNKGAIPNFPADGFNVNINNNVLRDIVNIDNDTDNNYFVMCIKGVIAKILTVVGTYSIFKKPEQRQNMITNPVRLVLGGNDETPKVIDDAIELYIRLPLLVEFYKVIFDDGNASYKTNQAPGDETDIIAFIPEIGSLWSGLIKIIFDKSKFISKQDLYSLQNMKDIVREVNKIYEHYASKGKEKVVREAFCGLIAEVNRRYGILKKCDINEYYQVQKRHQMAYLDDSAELQTNFDILDDANERDTSGPSAMYTVEQLKKLDQTNLIQTKDQELIEQFRTRVNRQLSDETKLNQVAPYSFEQRLRFYKDELKNTSSNDQKFELVVKAIEQSNDTSKNNAEAYILFHELVIAPCNALESLFNICKSFSTTLQSKFTGDSLNAGELSNVIELLYTFTGDVDGLLELKFITKNKVAIIYDELQTSVSNTVDNVKYMIGKFRNIINQELIERFEDPSNTFSIYYLEDMLLKHFIKNEVAASAVDSAEQTRYATLQTLDSFVPKLNKLLSDPNAKINDSTLFKTILWNNINSDVLVTVSKKSTMNDTFKKYDYKAKTWTDLTDELVKSGKTYNLDDTYDTLDSKGIVSRFNQLLNNYLNEFYDKSTKKIYVNLFSKTAEQTFSSIVYGKGIADLSAGGEGNAVLNESGVRMPDNNIVLMASVAYTMKKLLTRSLNPQLAQKYHAVTQLSEVSPHMVEELRAKLPAFIKLFKLLSDKCMLYKRILENDIISELPVVTPSIEVAQIVATDEDGSNFNILADFAAINESMNHRTTDYQQVLSNVVEGCTSIIKDATNVLDEVNSMDGKTGLFFEIKNEFIKDYHSVTKSLPFMPASSLLYTLNSNDTTVMLPNSGLHTNEFKFLYGVRSVLNGEKQGLKQMPYMSELFNKYNSSMRTANTIDSKNLEKMMEQLVCFSRYNADVYYYKNLLSMNNIAKQQVVATDKNNAYGRQAQLGALVDLTQNTFVANNKQKFFEYVNDLHTQGGTTDIITHDKTREAARILNIIDVNVVPINIHALMKEIPLANLYNYSISFNHMINRDLPYDIDAPVTGAPGLFTKLIKEPYANVSKELELGNVMYGNIKELHLFKPRFISDQLWVKASLDTNQQRRDTKLARDTIWFVNLQRMLRRKIRNELSEIKSKVVNENKVTSRQLTDYDGEHAQYNENEFDAYFN